MITFVEVHDVSGIYIIVIVRSALIGHNVYVVESDAAANFVRLYACDVCK